VTVSSSSARWPVDRKQRLAAARLYVVTDARRRQGDLADFLDRILGAGADIVQLREKEAEAGDLLRWGEVFRDASGRHGALFTVNDRPDVARALEADGVHVGQNDLPAPAAREILGERAIVGLSCHSEADLERAPAEADYLTVGPVHETPTKRGRPATGVDLVRFASLRIPRPWFAIGGLNPQTLPEVVEAGARRIVVVRAVAEADDAASAVRSLLSLLEKP
jgi:thiamine-phosphate pyrophosphorylase